eukprot:g10163.t1
MAASCYWAEDMFGNVRPLRSHPAARTGARKGLESSAASLLDLFRERVDYTVEASAERTSASPLRGDLRQLAEHVAGYLDNDGKKAVNAIISGTVDDVLAQHGDEEESLFAEMEQEHEQELFAEQEEEKEHPWSRKLVCGVVH